MKGKAVCITGSTQGIGLAIATSFARAGARIVINSHEDDDRGALGLLGDLTECHFVQADLSTVAGTRHLISTAHDRLGPLHTLVCNAGTHRDPAFADLTEEQVDQTLNLNIKGYLFCAQAFAAQVADGHDGASIICTGSTNSVAAELNSVAYDASKGAVLMMVRSLAVSLGGRGIRVNGIGPGIVETPLTQGMLAGAGTRERLIRQIPLGRISVPEDLGDVAVFLASPAARYITGQMIFVDGGILAKQLTWDDL
jgi:glucose 1-dehydrogenase